MARQISMYLQSETPAKTGVSASLGFLVSCAIIMASLAVRLPFSGSEAALLGHSLFGGPDGANAPPMIQLSLWIGNSVFPPIMATRGPFVVATILAGLTTLMVARRMGCGPYVSNLGLAWGFSSLLILGGGARVGQGPIGMLALCVFCLSVLRLLTKPSTAQWVLVGCAQVIMILAIPELAPACLAIAMAPVLIRTCRRWPTQLGFWATLGTAVVLIIPAANLNGITILWPAISLRAPITLTTAFLLFAISPLLWIAIVRCFAVSQWRPNAEPSKTIVLLIVLGCSVSFIASGLKADVLMACVPLFALAAANAVLAQDTRIDHFLADHTLPLSATTALTVLIYCMSAGTTALHQWPLFKQSAGWKSVALEIEALATQNEVGWIAVDTPQDAFYLWTNTRTSLPIGVAGGSMGPELECTAGGLYVGQYAMKPDFLETGRRLMPVNRFSNGIVQDQRQLSLVSIKANHAMCSATDS